MEGIKSAQREGGPVFLLDGPCAALVRPNLIKAHHQEDRMTKQKTTFALFFGNRSTFPSSFIAAARKEVADTLKSLGHGVIMLDEAASPHGAVETVQEGRIYAEFLRKHRGKFGGVILSLPNFGDENGAAEALKDAAVPILIQAYPDDLDKMAPQLRRDAFCGKLSIMDVFCQYGVRFTALKPHAVHPATQTFAANVDYFDRLCRVVSAMKEMIVVAVGARVTPFKTVRVDDLALQRYRITTESLDLSNVLMRVAALSDNDQKVKAKAEALKAYTSWKGVPQQAFLKLAKLGVTLDDVVEEYQADAVAVRCWIEIQEHLGISPCVLLSELNDRGIPAACETDVANAVTMYGLSSASGDVATCLDWNNNYGDNPDKCILFHCGPVPAKMMAARGQVTDNSILANTLGPGRAYGCNTGRIAPAPFTFGSMLTQAGTPAFYLGQGRFTNDKIPEDFFGCAGVAEINGLQNVLQTIGYLGYRHHVSLTPAHVLAPVREAFEKYLGYQVTQV
jgi:L-fucose isomerase-like protein